MPLGSNIADSKVYERNEPRAGFKVGGTVWALSYIEFKLIHLQRVHPLTFPKTIVLLHFIVHSKMKMAAVSNVYVTTKRIIRNISIQTFSCLFFHCLICISCWCKWITRSFYVALYFMYEYGMSMSVLGFRWRHIVLLSGGQRSMLRAVVHRPRSLFFPGLFGDAYISCGSLVEIVHRDVVLWLLYLYSWYILVLWCSFSSAVA